LTKYKENILWLCSVVSVVSPLGLQQCRLVSAVS